ncbi:hypothetical protein [Nostoc sp. 'Peltigera membranacea cyanobiont' 232]|uniref:hypothetical protein n=1 Tax=Nostoc sp. 'Peltigera membranacea cyanobiont' 232 TaxID=2014531 RepID=UPI000B95743C|nr:hypothetical protein [Nostoc sp. 'Peltigera membranacea cyanobiont' 232]OYE01353.1 hypothetical protein CDG79_30055 [Nostoc sp. 'Peltigera membranacea cyanobiont' 232]
MANKRETHCNNQVDTFAEALATARQMQQNWLTYGVDFVNFYVEDVDGDWLETWGHDEILGNSQLDVIKEFLVSHDSVAVKVREHLGERSLFDFAVNLEESWRISETNDRLSAIRHLLAGEGNSIDTDDIRLLELANILLVKLAEIL